MKNGVKVSRRTKMKRMVGKATDILLKYRVTTIEGKGVLGAC
jgi:hypothetical protein